MSIPTNAEILALLDGLNTHVADDLETQWLEFKPWTNSKDDMKVAVEYAACLANADGGVIVFGIADKRRGRASTIHGARGYDLDVWRRGIYAGVRPNLRVEVEELAVPEGTGKLLVVRVPKGSSPPYGTVQGLFKRRVGKNCMPLDPHSFLRSQISSGAVDWSGEPASHVELEDLDPLELARARAILRSKNPESELLKVEDADFLKGLGALRGRQVTNTGLVLFGKPEVLAEACPQSQVHYVHQISETSASRNDLWQVGLLLTLERIEQIFSSPANPEEELSVGLFKLRIPAYPLEAVREALLNAVTHRDYSDPGEVLIRHTPREMVVTSPGGFIGGITLQNILRHEPVARNRTLANAFVRLRLVEAAGMGRRRIFVPILSYGKRPPEFDTDGFSVSLKLFNLGYDKVMAALVSRLNQEGRDIGLDALMVLRHLREQPFVDATAAAELLQVDREEARQILDQMTLPPATLLERKGHTKTATYHLTKGLAKELLGKAAYTRIRGLNPKRYAELVREYLKDHQSISNREVRDLLGLGESASAQVEASRYLAKWSAADGFLEPFGRGNRRRYRLRGSS
jgi:ATP-dependent DNA helicase RecG